MIECERTSRVQQCGNLNARPCRPGLQSLKNMTAGLSRRPCVHHKHSANHTVPLNHSSTHTHTQSLTQSLLHSHTQTRPLDRELHSLTLTLTHLSLDEPPGFRCSALARIRQPVRRDSDLISTSGVLPMSPSNPTTTVSLVSLLAFTPSSEQQLLPRRCHDPSDHSAAPTTPHPTPTVATCSHEPS